MNHSNEQTLRQRAESHGQGHVFRFWEQLTPKARTHLLESLSQVDFDLMDRLIARWVLNDPTPERFSSIAPVPTISMEDPSSDLAAAVFAAGEQALRNGKVGLLMVAGGQGTRLGFDGPKGCYPIGPITGKSLFAYHAEKILNLQRRYDTELPWYIMVSAANEAATRRFFQDNTHFGLDARNILFFSQRMAP